MDVIKHATQAKNLTIESHKAIKVLNGVLYDRKFKQKKNIDEFDKSVTNLPNVRKQP